LLVWATPNHHFDTSGGFGGSAVGEMGSVGEVGVDILVILSKYEKNKQVVVYYNPINPQESVLETGASEETFVSLVYGGILIFIGVVIPIVFFIFRGSSAESIKFK
jgi:Protein of unknown function (DUF3592)